MQLLRVRYFKEVADLLTILKEASCHDDHIYEMQCKLKRNSTSNAPTLEKYV